MINGCVRGTGIETNESSLIGVKYLDDDRPEIKELPGGRKFLHIYEPGSRHAKYIDCSLEEAKLLGYRISKTADNDIQPILKNPGFVEITA